MRIGIDARFFGPRCKGLGRYVQKLLEQLVLIDKENKYYVFLTKEGFESFEPKNKNFKKVLADYQWYTWKEQFFFPMLLMKYKLDVVHFCHFNVPIFYWRKFIVTVHDLILFHYPTVKNTTLNRFLYFFKLRVYHLVISSAVRRSEKIVAVSKFTQEDVIEKLKIKKEKIAVVYEGYEIINNKKDNSWLKNDAFFSGYGIIKPYIMYVGNAYPHKNLERLCLAFQLLKNKFNDFKLVIVGETDYFYNRLEKFILKNKIKGVIFTGFISDNRLEELYKNAECFVFPSLYEGFGLPPLEAISRGVAVSCSNRSSMPEILGGGADYFNPEDFKSIASSIEKILTDTQYKQEIIKQGKERLKFFSWEKMAEETKKEYNRINEKQAIKLENL